MANKKVALITGASRGIGAAVARLLIKNVDLLLVNGRDMDALKALANELGMGTANGTTVNIEALAFDVADAESVKEAFQSINKQYKQLDILVNCAGVMPEAAMMMTSAEQLQQVFAVNTFGSFYCAQYASRLMARNRSGAIVNIASVVAEQGSAGQVAYSASKAALKGMTASMAKELAPMGVRVNSVAPGFIETELVAHYSAKQRQQLISQTALGRLGQADDVAAVVAFLCSESASYITGQTIAVDGCLQL